MGCGASALSKYALPGEPVEEPPALSRLLQSSASRDEPHRATDEELATATRTAR